MPHLSLTITGLPVNWFKNGLGLSAIVFKQYLHKGAQGSRTQINTKQWRLWRDQGTHVDCTLLRQGCTEMVSMQAWSYTEIVYGLSLETEQWLLPIAHHLLHLSSSDKEMSQATGAQSTPVHISTGQGSPATSNLAEQLRSRLVATSDILSPTKPPSFRVARKRPYKSKDEGSSKPKLEPLVSLPFGHYVPQWQSSTLH